MVSLVAGDRHTDVAASAVLQAGAAIATSDFLSAEVFAVLTKRLRTGALDTTAFEIAASAYDLFVRSGAINHTLTAADGALAVELVRRIDLKLRAPDALHLAICRRIGAALLSFDDNQCEAAANLGISLAVIPARPLPT